MTIPRGDIFVKLRQVQKKKRIFFGLVMKLSKHNSDMFCCICNFFPTALSEQCLILNSFCTQHLQGNR